MKLQEFSQRPVPVSIQVLQYHAGIYHVPLTGRQFPVFPKTAPPVIFRFQSQLLFYRDHMDPAAAFDEFFVIHQFPGLVFPYKLHFLAFMMRAVMGGEILHHSIRRFGKLSHGSIHVRWNRNKEYYDQAPWRGTWAQDGGALMNQCIHGIDLLRWMLGDEVEEVYGVTRQQFHHYLEAEDIGMAVVKFKNGAVGTIEGTTNVYPKNLEETLYLFGENGTVKLGGKSTNNIDVWDFADEGEADQKNKGLEEATSNVYGNGHTSLYADVIDAIENDRAPYVDAVAGRNALEMVLAIYQSQKEGRPVKLPLHDFGSLDMKGEFGK